jgi:hypothetical protein
MQGFARGFSDGNIILDGSGHCTNSGGSDIADFGADSSLTREYYNDGEAAG